MASALILFPGISIRLIRVPENAERPVKGQDAFDLNDSSGMDLGYEVERREAGAAWLLAGNAGLGASGWVDRTVEANRVYEYRVRAFNNAGYSPYSETAGVLTPDGIELAATAWRQKNRLWVNLTWESSADGLVEVYRDSQPIALGTLQDTFTDELPKGMVGATYRVCQPALGLCSEDIYVSY
jgi:hypothetical protein